MEAKMKDSASRADGSEKMKDSASRADGRKELENKENKDAGEDNFSAYGQTYIKDDFFLSVVTALTGVTNSVSQPIWGLLLDKTSYKDCMASVNALLTAFMLTFYATPYGYKIMFTVWVLAIEFVMSAVFVLIPAACAKVYGAKHSGTSVGFVFIFPSMSCVLGALAIQFIQDSFGWFGSFGFISSLTFMAFIATLFFPEREKVKKVQGELREPKQ
ncbi:uncharacterized protein LOC143224675 isoform X2 [Tachypleus tridentatus]|uniref:uncharacterized protein LOC143224675 isoform X2 n=1 Tax=Tachypleus tridentatus TaxID=6853 RepID=UPI003FD055E6